MDTKLLTYVQYVRKEGEENIILRDPKRTRVATMRASCVYLYLCTRCIVTLLWYLNCFYNSHIIYIHTSLLTCSSSIVLGRETRSSKRSNASIFFVGIFSSDRE